jgi:hypothetical protein
MKHTIKLIGKVLIIDLIVIFTITTGLFTMNTIELQYTKNIADGKGPRNGDILLCRGGFFNGANYCNISETLEDYKIDLIFFTTLSFSPIALIFGYPYTILNYIFIIFLFFYFIKIDQKKKKPKPFPTTTH